jgi:hypothetical protein
MFALPPKADIGTQPLNVRFGSKADIATDRLNVRFTSKSGHWLSAPGCPLCAKSGLMRRSNLLLFGHLVGAHN